MNARPPTVNGEATESVKPPQQLGAIAAWFAEAVRAEVEELDKAGREQRYELLSGKLTDGIDETEAIYVFTMADPARVPEEASGTLNTQTDSYNASIVGQDGNRLHVQIGGAARLPSAIHRAFLLIDDTALLRRLAEVLEARAADASLTSQLASTVFHPERAKVGFAELPGVQELVEISGQQRRVVEQACGSSVTYVWGPPGTGKTYVIAHLIAALVEAGERVLLASHTNAAVDQCLYEAVRPSENGVSCGPLARHSLVEEGRILRIGRTASRKVPDAVRLDKVAERKAEELTAAIAELNERAQPLRDDQAKATAALAAWDRLDELSSRLRMTRKAALDTEGKRSLAEKAVAGLEGRLGDCRADLERAERAWFLRGLRVRHATEKLKRMEDQLQHAEQGLESTREGEKRAQEAVTRAEEALAKQNVACEGLLSREDAKNRIAVTSEQLSSLDQRIRALQDQIPQLERELIDGARALFCTLTKNYTAREIEELSFDAVIVDEISIALPPLIFLAAARAVKRVVLVGDFYQLPPIVRSDAEVSNMRLGSDVFQLAGVAQQMELTDSCPVRTTLGTQRRMHPDIAEVARHLVYRRAGLDLIDHSTVLDRKRPEWMDFLPENSLVIVDTADFHCWSGKVPGSLSRFNFYSATVAVEVAAIAAASASQPREDEPQPVGIVSPFAAQRRLLGRLVKSLDLDPWVAAGTVHTFQGGQAELIIFDSVLDEPYWTAMLVNPRYYDRVMRELNVAVTRAKSKLVFVGSSEWLNNHAKPASGLGQLWAYLKDHADLVSAFELVKGRLPHPAAHEFASTQGWRLPEAPDGSQWEVLDEQSFFNRFSHDMADVSESVFGLAPYFGEYRWPRIQPLFADALRRDVTVTLVTPPLSQAPNPSYVERAIRNLRQHGAVVITSTGLHGKDIILDERILYTGSMNWCSSRGRSETVHRIYAPEYAKLCLEFLQAKYIRTASVYEDGTPRLCPQCGFPTHLVNQRVQHGRWDKQAMKIGCSNPECSKYLVDLDERAPFRRVPVCQVDGRSKYRRVRRGRGERWVCPKHPKQCKSYKVVPGDPE